MAKKKRVRKPSDYSLAQLQDLVNIKASELKDLKAKRAEAQRELNDLDRLIRETEGGTRKKASAPKKRAMGATSASVTTTKKKKKKKVARKGKGTRPQNTRSAKSYAQDILKKESQGLPLDELANRILASGYKSNSASFKNTLYQSLYNDRKAGKTFDYNEKTGRWTLR